MIHCPNCGHPVPDDAAYCANCGGLLTPGGGRPAPQKRPKRGGCLGTIFKGILLFLAFCFVVGLFAEPPRTSEEAFEQYMQGVFGGNAEQLDGLFVEEAVARQMGQEDFDVQDCIDVGQIQADFAQTFGPDYQINYRLVSEYELSGDALQGMYALFQLAGMNVQFQSVKYLTYELSVTGSKYQESDTRTLLAAQMDDSWYIFMDS